MQIAGLEKNSAVDYPGEIATVVFTVGCNLRCRYCHNFPLISAQRGAYTIEAALAEIRRQSVLFKAVVVSGGEPTLQSGLASFIRAIKAEGCKVKLDTNGLKPEVLRELLDVGLLDYVAMDIKAPLEKYEQIAGVDVDVEAVAESIELLMDGDVLYEFRTTFDPDLTPADIVEIATRISGARLYAVQQFRQTSQDQRTPHQDSYVFRAVELARVVLPVTAVRGLTLTEDALRAAMKETLHLDTPAEEFAALHADPTWASQLE
jgi:pyruvate formate lyase activating enzyme